MFIRFYSKNFTIKLYSIVFILTSKNASCKRIMTNIYNNTQDLYREHVDMLIKGVFGLQS